MMHQEGEFRQKKLSRWAIGDMPSQFFQFFAFRTNFLKINQVINNALGTCIYLGQKNINGRQLENVIQIFEFLLAFQIS